MGKVNLVEFVLGHPGYSVELEMMYPELVEDALVVTMHRKTSLTMVRKAVKTEDLCDAFLEGMAAELEGLSE